MNSLSDRPNPKNLEIPACRFCQHYTSAGRRGGTCSILQSEVSGDWQACSVALPLFSQSDRDSQSLPRLQIGNESKIQAVSVVKKVTARFYSCK